MEIRWDSLTGHRAQVQELTALLQEGRLPHALLFTGAAGIGKKLCAQILAAAILCGHDHAPCGLCDNCRAMAAGTHPDYYELVPEVRGKSTRIIRIEEIREMQTVVSRSAVRAGRRVVLIDDADTMNEPAANSLLKTLEEPEGQVTFILIARDRSSLLDTIVSRCMPLAFGPLSHEEVRGELLKRQLPADEAEKLAFLADGSLGQALKLSQHGGLELRDNALAFLVALPSLNQKNYGRKRRPKGKWIGRVWPNGWATFICCCGICCCSTKTAVQPCFITAICGGGWQNFCRSFPRESSLPCFGRPANCCTACRPM